VIKPFAEQPRLPEDFEDSAWTTLREAVRGIYATSTVSQSREELYQTVESLCIHKKGARLYERLAAECDVHVGASVAGLAAARSLDATLFLERVRGVWTDHCSKMLTVRNIFLYLDRSYVIQTPAVQSIWEMGLSLLRSHICGHAQLEATILEALLGLIERERNGEELHIGLLHGCVRMLVALGLYTQRFEARFLEETAQYYEKEGNSYVAATDVPGFLLHVQQRLSQENERINHYMEQRSRRDVIGTVEQHLLAPHAQSLLDRGLHALIAARRIEDLRRTYSLYTRVNKVDVLLAAFTEDIKACGAKLVNDQENEGELVKNLLLYNEDLAQILSGAFDNNKEFAFKLKTAWEYFLNIRQTRPAELLARFLDGQMRSQKGMSEEDVEAVLDRVMAIFRHLADKDVFEAFYKLGLAKRLLLRKSVSHDLERSMIARLKGECGAGYTNKLEGMFKDIHLSDDFMANYAEHLEANPPPPGAAAAVETRVQVLTTGFWPTQPPVEVNLPPVLRREAERFVEFYMRSFQGRRLAWQHNLGHCVLVARFTAGTKRLEVSQFQAMVLLCFNDTDALSCADIQAATAIEAGEVRRTLQSLSLGKQRVLLRQRPSEESKPAAEGAAAAAGAAAGGGGKASKEILDGTVFRFNAKYTNPKTRIHINTIQLKATVAEANKTNEAVRRDRLHIIDAAVVRIMKTRKTVAHALLMGDVLGQLKFPVTPSQVKARIESLIEREYMARDEEQTSVYNYLA